MPEISDVDTSLITARTPIAGFPVASLFFIHGERAGQEVPLTIDTVFIGRSNNNNLVLTDKSVSRKHAVINIVGSKFVISDLNSLKGTYVNGKKIEETTLQPGDIINIGENRMQFRILSPSGNWISPGRRGRFWYFLLIIVLGLLIGGATWFFMDKRSEERMPDHMLTRIEIHYERGVEFFNKEHDVHRARDEWKRILELDPEKKTDYAVKAAKLLKNTEPEKPSE